MSHPDVDEADIQAFLRDDLNWQRVFASARPTPEPALFLDRDGVIIEERNYLSDPAGVTLIPGASRLICKRSAAGQAIVIITNQSGIGRGRFDWHAYRSVEDRMLELLAADGATVDIILACPFHPEGGRPPYDRDHPWRKPGAGMLLEACRILNLDLNRSLLIGDKASDIAAACAAGLPSAIHVATGHGGEERSKALALASHTFRVNVAASIADVT